MKSNPGCVSSGALVRGHRSNPIFHPISHPRLRSIRFSTVSKGSPTSTPFRPLPEKKRRREIATLFLASTGQKAQEMDLVRFQPVSSQFQPPTPSDLPSLLRNRFKTESYRAISLHFYPDFPPFRRGKNNICRKRC